ncbi:uncharacterized protein ANIA_10014 [Aspergillus nidulans FGSC A4]|uniref:Uncharacterized protein n=1 Tax=Emericella nidulans (strain FGSC A4 / ATCC 38163 / CBS 112.46 / NRRL 194 / M139) TaxID=227321 RepID=C8VR23_EMENI|nr:hypothetical protein [Aspergillus nidulans FGSC A4]CBF90288.1 TPA: hypothetical protein ANIA_10014 [Aspergillus nidulans FGSC A4]
MSLTPGMTNQSMFHDTFSKLLASRKTGRPGTANSILCRSDTWLTLEIRNVVERSTRQSTRGVSGVVSQATDVIKSSMI